MNPHAPIPASVSSRLSPLLALVYEGTCEATPWQSFAKGLRAALEARNVMITLHHVEAQGRDTYVMASPPDDDIDWAAAETMYRAEFMQHDPLRPDLMQPGQLGLLDIDALEPQRLGLLKRLGLSHCLRACVEEPGGLRCWIDAVRSHAQPEPHFSADDVALVRELLPHVMRALHLFARLHRQESERAIYAGMVEHFALGCMLLNEAGELLHANRVAAAIVQRWPGLAMHEGRLKLRDRERQREFDAALDAIVQSRCEGGEPNDGTLVRLDNGRGHLLALLVCPAPLHDFYQGAPAPCFIVYLSELSAGPDALRPIERASQGHIAHLFGLTRQEARLAILLAYGHTLAEAAREMGIAEVAVRNYSKKIYAKLGIGGQTELVRLMLRGISFLR